MNINKAAALATFLVATSYQAHAAAITLKVAGPGVGATIDLLYGPSTDAKYPQAFEITGISGTFSDSNNGLNIVNASITSLVAITHSTPEPGNLLAPNDFSRFAVATGLDPVSNGFLTYDNLLYPGGSPQTASDYPGAGGLFDIYGLMFTLSNGKVVDLWSNGSFVPNDPGPFDYGVAVADANQAYDYLGGVSVTATPEPSAFLLLGGGLAGLFALRRRTSR